MKFHTKFNFEFNFFSGAILIGLILVSFIFGIVIYWQVNISLNKKIAETEEAQRPAELKLTILQDKNCQDCFKLQGLIDGIQKQHTKIMSENKVDMASDEGKMLIKKFVIKKLPTLIVSGELNKETSLKDLWLKIGEITDNTFILRQVGMPYVESVSGEVRGRVQAIILTDKSCTTCYNPMVHQKILASYGWPIDSQKIIDKQDIIGQTLIQKYKIKFLPTIVLQGDVEVYQKLKQIWPKVGTIETDGTYVFRDGVKQMGTYKDLITGKIVAPIPVASTQSK